jgi:hypothetical protein
MNYSDKHKVLWATPMRAATRSCIPIQKYFGFDVIGHHGLQIPEGKEDYYFVLNTRNPYTRMISIYHLFCLQFNIEPNNFNGWIRKEFDEKKRFPYDTLNLNYQIFLKEKIFKTPDLIIKLENLYSDILKLPFFADNSDELFDIVNNNILTNHYSSGYDYNQYYNQDLADYVYSILEEDFVYFNYNKNSWKDVTS